jgi:hypothetical protein
MPFQTVINRQQAPAIAGDFASANPRASVLAGEGALVTGPNGVTVGQFAWALAGLVTNNFALGGQVGFVHRDLQALITAWLGQTSMVIPAGLAVTLMEQGDFWGKFAGGAAIGQKVYASYADGSLSAAATATPPQSTGGLVSTTNASALITVTTAPTQPIVVGQPISGAGIPAGAYIASLVTGTGGLGTYNLSAPATATATGVAATLLTAVETPFVVRSLAAAGELAKISTWG